MTLVCFGCFFCRRKCVWVIASFPFAFSEALKRRTHFTLAFVSPPLHRNDTCSTFEIGLFHTPFMAGAIYQRSSGLRGYCHLFSFGLPLAFDHRVLVSMQQVVRDVVWMTSFWVFETGVSPGVLNHKKRIPPKNHRSSIAPKFQDLPMFFFGITIPRVPWEYTEGVRSPTKGPRIQRGGSWRLGRWRVSKQCWGPTSNSRSVLHYIYILYYYIYRETCIHPR